MQNSKSAFWPLALLLLSLLLVGVVVIDANEPELRQLNVVFRHGDRTPETFPKRFPNDPNMYETFHPMGSGGLTNVGKLRAYHLGKILRDRYDKFLSTCDANNRDCIYAISSDVVRTKLSLQLLLAALYPPSSDSKWHELLNWKPIPTHYFEFKKDTFFNSDRCQTYMDELTRVQNLTEVRAKLEEYNDFLEDLRVAMGSNSNVSLNDILILHNNLDVEKRMNLTMLPWMEDTLADDRLKKLRMLFYEIHSYTESMRRMQAGYMLRTINKDMLEASSNTDFKRKVTLYSGHDKNIINLLNSLKMYDGHFPEFCSALIFELWYQDEQYYVKIFYHLGIPNELKDLSLPGCDNSCLLSKYLNLTRDAEIQDHELNCTITSDAYFKDSE